MSKRERMELLKQAAKFDRLAVSVSEQDMRNYYLAQAESIRKAASRA